MQQKVHIIGAGLAGLAAAVKLTHAGRQVILYESSAVAGGRCRSFDDPVLGRHINNGNHLILHANQHARAYISLIGSEQRFEYTRYPKYLFMDASTGAYFTFKPYWVLRSLIALMSASELTTVAECFNNDSVIYRCFIIPFCTSALNTSPSEASARLLKRTLWKVVRAGKRGLSYYLPKHSLSDSLIEPALHTITQHHGVIHYNSAIKKLVMSNGAVKELRLAGKTIDTSNDLVVMATPPHIAKRLMPDIGVQDATNAILNAHFVWSEGHWPFSEPLVGLTEATAQWVFHQHGMLSTTTSAAEDDLVALDHGVLASRLWSDITKLLGDSSLSMPAYRIICEKRATFAATPALQRSINTRYGNIILVGDYTLPSMPATIDSAVYSGFLAAEHCLQTSHGAVEKT